MYMVLETNKFIPLHVQIYMPLIFKRKLKQYYTFVVFVSCLYFRSLIIWNHLVCPKIQCKYIHTVQDAARIDHVT
jgi:hypothetical protein